MGGASYIFYVDEAFNSKDVEIALGAVVGGRAPGPDGIPAYVFLYDKTRWGKYIMLLATAIARGATIPDSWKGAEIIPVYKKGDKSLPGNYRSISLIDSLQKILGRLILNKIQEWVEEYSILSPLQAGFRAYTSTINQVFRFVLLHWKVVVLGKGSMYAAFVDLKSAFDLVPCSRLWATLQALGLPIELLTLLKRLHEGNYAKIRWGSQGQLTNAFPVERGVRQGCVMAPTLFTVFINGIVDCMTRVNTDAPILAGIKISILMFADNTLIISKTPSELQRALTVFEEFCSARGLEVNVSKTKLMTFNQHKVFKGGILMNNSPLVQVREFSYLGVNIQSNLKWNHQIDMATLKHRQLSGALRLEHNRSFTKPIRPVLQVYDAKVVSSALYGVELWGLENLSKLSVSENKFLQGITNLPQSTPLCPLFYDLERKPLLETAKLRIVLYWLRLWTTPELTPYAEGFMDIIKADTFHKISWLRGVKDILAKIGMSMIWDDPTTARFPTKKVLKEKYWEMVTFNALRASDSSSLVGTVLEFKLIPSFEPYWDTVTKPLDRKLYFQLRAGTLPLRAFTSRWNKSCDSKCPSCLAHTESVVHMLFACPAY